MNGSFRATSSFAAAGSFAYGRIPRIHPLADFGGHAAGFPEAYKHDGPLACKILFCYNRSGYYAWSRRLRLKQLGKRARENQELCEAIREIHRYSKERYGAPRMTAAEYIEIFYNRQRLHSTLGYTTPEAFEAPSKTETQSHNQCLRN